MADQDNLMDKIVSLCKRRGFVYPGSEIYGGLANTWDYGPLGAELKNNIKKEWWNRFVHQREDIYGLDGGVLLNPKIWEASGHVSSFTDPLVECKTCHKRFRLDQIEGFAPKGEYYEFTGSVECPTGGHPINLDVAKKLPNDIQLVKPRRFNGMFKTFVGPTEDSTSIAYLRPETAQAIFANFKNVLNSFSPSLPFGIAQIGKAFRNEITPGNFIFRTLEFEIMEIENFIEEKDWEKTFESWQNEIEKWLVYLGINREKLHWRRHAPEELSHYSKRTEDIEYDFPFGRKEVYGLAYRTDYDLRNHAERSGQDLKYRDPQTGNVFFPHVVEPAMGVDRTVITVLTAAYTEEKSEKETRVVLRLKPRLAPYKAAVFPLLANKSELVKTARKVFEDLQKQFVVTWDDHGNIGKRYRRQDEIGTPWCITVDFDTLKDHSLTVRERDSMKQERVGIDKLVKYLENGLEK